MNIWRARRERSEGELLRVERERSWRGTWQRCHVELVLLLKSHWHGLTPELSRAAARLGVMVNATI